MPKIVFHTHVYGHDELGIQSHLLSNFLDSCSIVLQYSLIVLQYSLISLCNKSLTNVITLYYYIYIHAGPPFSVESFSIGEVCINDFSVSWDPVTGNPVCGPVSYDVTISSSDGVVMRTTDTSYNFTGLMPNNSYTVTVAGRNDAGVGGLDILNVPTPSLEDGLPSSSKSRCNVYLVHVFVLTNRGAQYTNI